MLFDTSCRDLRRYQELPGFPEVIEIFINSSEFPVI